MYVYVFTRNLDSCYLVLGIMQLLFFQFSEEFSGKKIDKGFVVFVAGLHILYIFYYITQVH